MAYNQDKKYDHPFAKEFTPKSPPDRNTNHGEASPQRPIDWKEMKGNPKPFEAEYESDPHMPDGKAEETDCGKRK
jgi:hypothetical protein